MQQPFPGGRIVVPATHVGQGLAFAGVTALKFTGHIIDQNLTFNKYTQVQIMNSNANTKIVLLIFNQATANKYKV